MFAIPERLIIPFIVAFLVAVAVAPKTIAVLRKLKAGQVIQQEGPQTHLAKAGTPAMGGIIIMLGFGASVLVGLLIGRPDQFVRMSMVLGITIIFAAIGFADDWLTVHPRGGSRGIGSKPKFLIQLAVAIGFVVYAHQIGILSPTVSLGWRIVDLGWAYFPLAVLFVVGMANFVNITDGLDGLVAGLTVILTVLLSIFTPAGSSWLFASLGGACAAFLIFNRHPAKVFMGDTGSLAIGAAIPAIAIVYHAELAVCVAALVFILDGLSSALQWAVFKYTRIRTGTGRRVFKMSPIHHHFELSGWPETTVVKRFWLAGLICGLATIAIGFWSSPR